MPGGGGMPGGTITIPGGAPGIGEPGGSCMMGIPIPNPGTMTPGGAPIATWLGSPGIGGGGVNICPVGDTSTIPGGAIGIPCGVTAIAPGGRPGGGMICTAPGGSIAGNPASPAFDGSGGG